MKTKSKIATDIKSLVLAKSKIYTKNEASDESSGEEDESKSLDLRLKEVEKEKKREKMKLKKQKKKDARAKSAKKDDNEAKTEALNYLHLWHSSRHLWSFKKKQQYWLLQNTFNRDLMSDADFEILLEYIVELKGAAKTRLLEESEKVIKAEEHANETQGESPLTFERARQIQQILV